MGGREREAEREIQQLYTLEISGRALSIREAARGGGTRRARGATSAKASGRERRERCCAAATGTLSPLFFLFPTWFFLFIFRVPHFSRFVSFRLVCARGVCVTKSFPPRFGILNFERTSRRAFFFFFFPLEVSVRNHSRRKEKKERKRKESLFSFFASLKR